ncbi:MAG: hypothetical protein QNK40_00355 [Desulfobacterales bacterium]|nr:hypothetical protein [Desulfobacterales bacterium]
MTAAREGISTEPIMNKAMEGMAKQIKEQNIISAMEAVYGRHTYANQLAKSLSNDPKSIETMTQTIADGLTAGMKAQNMEPVVAHLKARTLQQTKNKAENNNLAIQTMQTLRTMARLGIKASVVSDILCEALQSQYTHLEMNQLLQHLSQQAHLISPQQIVNQHAKSIGKAGNASGVGASSGGGNGGGGPGP